MGRLLNIPEEVHALLNAGAPVAYGVSGGKDGETAALELDAHLDAIGHPRAKRVVIHADLGEIEWADSQPQAERLAKWLGLPFVVVRRAAGGMLERWESRWASSVRRYANLECVTLIPPWSSAALRFCTSELKVAPITSELKRRFPGETIVSVTGIRGEESRARRAMPVFSPQPRLTAVRARTSGINFNPIIDYTLDDVKAVHAESGFPWHEAYATFGARRVSCSLCILSTKADQLAALDDERNRPAHARIVALEVRSGFSFQSDRWAADLRPDLLSKETTRGLVRAKLNMVARIATEKTIPRDLLYDGKGWPKRMPTIAEAELLAGVRRDIQALQEFPCAFTTVSTIINRYAELIAEREAKAA